MSALLPILGMALLFVAFGLLKPRRRCGGQCGGCETSCTFGESRDEGN